MYVILLIIIMKGELLLKVLTTTKNMKILDKFLKWLNTDRNTFFTYILSLITLFILIDRLTEFFIILFSGVASTYWGPIPYAFAILCTAFAYLFSCSSKFVKGKTDKLKWFYIYCTALYIIFISMLTEWGNKLCWLGLLSLPGYPTIASEFSYLIKPALSSITIYLPLATISYFFRKLYTMVNDTKDLKDSIGEYNGISLSDKSKGWGQFTNELFIGIDKDTSSPLKIPESKRFESLFVCGISGSGKTSLIFEPCVAQDIDKKYFFKENSKSMAFACLKTGLATLNAPYDNNYINSNFRLTMIKPVESKIDLYKSYMKKLIYSDIGGNIIYRDLGITYMSPDFETISKVWEVCKNFGIPVKIIDPDFSNSPGLNPFAFEDATQTAIAISTVLKGLYTDRNPEMASAYRENLTSQILENLTILLKLIYPKMNEGKLPNLEDLFKLLSNFSLVEKMCRILESDSELAEKYHMQLAYFKKNFYANSPNKAEMEQAVSIPIAQLDTLLRYPGVKNILCNRVNNLNYDNELSYGGVNLVCTRRGDLGESAHKAFGLFFLLLMQYSVLRRPGNENTRIPHFLYIDEFPDFICPSTEALFTIYRKYRVATIISAQNLDQLKRHGEKLSNTIIANCANKIVFGNNSPQDNEWWSKEIGDKREWVFSNTYDTAKGEYDPKYSGIKYRYKPKYEPGKIQALKFKSCMYTVKDNAGKNVTGTAQLEFLDSKYKEKQNIKIYNFTKFTNGMTDNETRKTKKLNLKNAHFTDDDMETNPIKIDTSNSNFLLDNDEAITHTFNKGKKTE